MPTEKDIIKRFINNSKSFKDSTRDTYFRRGLKYLQFCREENLDFLDSNSLKKFLEKYGKEDYYKAKRFLEIAGIFVPKQGIREFVNNKKAKIFLKDGELLNAYIIDIETPFIVTRTEYGVVFVNLDMVKKIVIWSEE